MKVPSPGESITEVEIASWLVEDGDYVEKDQAIAEVDSDKATLELPAEEVFHYRHSFVVSPKVQVTSIHNSVKDIKLVLDYDSNCRVLV